MTLHDRHTVAVTGGTGFVGRTLVQRLLDAGMQVKLLSRRPDAGRVFNSSALEVCVGDLFEPTTLRSWTNGAATVYHLAGETRDIGRFSAINVQGTINVLTASEGVGVRRVVYLSSAGVIGADGTAREVDERTPTQPRNAYESSKLAAETECLRRNQPDFAVTALRPPIIYGDGKKSRKDGFLSLLRLLRARRLPLLGRQYVSSYAYVGDVAAACQTLADHPLAGGRAFILSEPIPLTTFLNEAAAILGVREPWVLPGWAGRPMAGALRQTGRFGSLFNETHYDGDALANLGFQLPFGYREGLRRTLTWYRQAGLL